MLVQGNVYKESVSFPVLDGEFEPQSDAESGAEQQEVVAISFRPGREKGYKGDEDDKEEITEDHDDDSGKTKTMEPNLEKIFVELFDEDETNLNLILEKAASFGDAKTNTRILAHLQRLKILSNELYQKTYAGAERAYLCYMTTTTKDLSEIDGVILRHYYLEKFTWKSDLLSSLRILCSRLYFKGESQNIDIMIHSFANNWYSRFNQPSFIYGNIIGVYLVTYALILLNTDLHNDAIVAGLRESSQHSLPASSVGFTRRKSGSLFDIFSHDTSSSIHETESEGRKRPITCITKNQFVMNTIAALNDNFVIVNPLIMRKQLRLYYSNVKSYEIMLPKLECGHGINKRDSVNDDKRALVTVERQNNPLTVEDSTADDTLVTGEDPNDEVTELRTLPSLKHTNSIPSVASTKVSFELVSGTIKETTGPFGFLKNTEKHETSEGLDTKDMVETPIVKEGLQKILVNDYYITMDRSDDRYNSSALLFKDIPDIPTTPRTPVQQPVRRRKSLIERIMRARGINRRQKELPAKVPTMEEKPDFKFAECFVAICDGELRIFEFDKNPDKVNSYSGHGRGAWTDWAQCLASVMLAGCYAEVIGKSKRRSSQDEKKRLVERFGDRVYWKLELPYSMMEMVNNEMANTGAGPAASRRRSRSARDHRSERWEKFEKMIFTSYSEETAAEFVNTCNYWSGMQSKVPNVKTQFFDEMHLTSLEYGFSEEIVSVFTGLSATLTEEGSKVDSKAKAKSHKKNTRELVDRLQTLLLSEKGIAEWRPVVHSCETVLGPISTAVQVQEMTRYMDELSGAFCHERRLLELVRAVYNGLLLPHGSRPLLEAVLTVYENHRTACLALLRERRRWREQRCVLMESLGGKEDSNRR